MSAQWKSGDVAAVRCDASDWHTALRVGDRWICENGDGNEAQHVSEARPLVVIDPEDREQTAALTKALMRRDITSTIDIHAAVQRALRSLVNPPRPDEPQGLGAVVEDAEGKVWVRWTRGDGLVWRCSSRVDFRSCDWTRFAAVRVLSEGVTP